MNAADEIVLNERVTKLEVIAEVTIQTLDRLERRMDAGFRESRADVVKTSERLERQIESGHQESRLDVGKIERQMEAGRQESRSDLERLERRMETGFQELWADNQALRGEFQALRTHVDNTFRWLIGTQIMTTLAVLGMMAKSAKLF